MTSNQDRNIARAETRILSKYLDSLDDWKCKFCGMSTKDIESDICDPCFSDRICERCGEYEDGIRDPWICQKCIDKESDDASDRGDFEFHREKDREKDNQM